MYLSRALVWYYNGKKTYGKAGYEQASKKFDPKALEVDLSGKNYLVTGANSGIGKITCEALAERKATVYMLCRNHQRAELARKEVMEKSKNDNVHVVLCDISNLTDIRNFCQEFVAKDVPLHGLVNNAGVMYNEPEETAEGYDKNFATNVLGTYLLTDLLMPSMKKADASRVVIVSSGGMLTEKLDVNDLHMRRSNKYEGTRAYAQNKRAQVYMTEGWARMHADTNVSFFSMHPGWADTPAVRTSMPSFYESNKGMFRTDVQGADTVVWLLISPNVAVKKDNGKFFFDRSVTDQHLSIGGTSSSSEEISTLWDSIHRMTKGLSAYTQASSSDLCAAMQKPNGLELADRSYHGNVYPSCFVGKDLVTWLVENNYAKSRDDAVKIGELLVDMHLVEHVCREHTLRDKALFYRFTAKALMPPKVREVIPDAFLEEMDKLANNSAEWSLSSSVPRTNTRVYVSRSTKDGLKSCKVTTVIHAPVSALSELLHDNLLERHKEWNSTFMGGKLLQEEDADCNVQMWMFETATGMSNRDFVVARRRFTLDDGTIVLVDRSVQHPDAPLSPKFIRSNLPYNVRWMKPIEDGAATEFVYMNLTDLGGYIPAWLVNTTNGSVSCSEIDHIRSCVEKK